MTIHGAILRLAALFVPAPQRREWMSDWQSELWYVVRGKREAAVRFCLGAFQDAIWLRRNSPKREAATMFRVQSPSGCMLWLTGAAAVSTFVFFGSRGIPPGMRIHGGFVFPHVLMIAIALLILPATTSFALGEYPANPGSPARMRRCRRSLFLGLKFALIVPIVFCGIADLAWMISATGLQPHATLGGYVLAFRWALEDQRQRCPVCLRLLANPVRIGQPSQAFLEWYGTELLCVKGHGMLHVPEIRTTYSTERWLDAHPSWSSLFS